MSGKFNSSSKSSFKDWLFEVNKGNVAGHSMVHKFGRNSAAGTGVEDIHFGGGVLAPLTAAATIEAVSASTNDASAGTHARTITIWGVDGSFNEINETITMNGTSASTATSQSFLRVYRARVTSTGTYNVANDGNITIRVSGAGATQIVMASGTGVSQTSHYTVPDGYTAYVVRVSIDVDSSKTAQIILNQRGNTNLTSPPFDSHQHVHEWTGVTGNISEDFVANHELAAKTDIWAESIAGSVSTPLEIDYDLLIVQDGY